MLQTWRVESYTSLVNLAKLQSLVRVNVFIELSLPIIAKDHKVGTGRLLR